MSNCTGACTTLWPPLVVPTGGELKAGVGVKATLLTTIERAGGTRQVAYGGVPLYRYTGDKKAGQATGQGGGRHLVRGQPIPTHGQFLASSTAASPNDGRPIRRRRGTVGNGAPRCLSDGDRTSCHLSDDHRTTVHLAPGNVAAEHLAADNGAAAYHDDDDGRRRIRLLMRPTSRAREDRWSAP